MPPCRSPIEIISGLACTLAEAGHGGGLTVAPITPRRTASVNLRGTTVSLTVAAKGRESRQTASVVVAFGLGRSPVIEGGRQDAAVPRRAVQVRSHGINSVRRLSGTLAVSVLLSLLLLCNCILCGSKRAMAKRGRADAVLGGRSRLPGHGLTRMSILWEKKVPEDVGSLRPASAF